MLPLSLGSMPEGLRILCVGAHCDDIEIGCGGTIMRLSQELTNLHVKWIVFTSNPVRSEEFKKSANHFLQNVKSKEVVVRNLRDGFLPYEGDAPKKVFEELKDFRPDLIFTHYRSDLHQDHRILNELTWNTFRNHLILEYEIPKYDGDLGNPNCFVPIDASLAEDKVHAILNSYASQTAKQWFDQETFLALMRLRGMEAASRYAEAFYVRKYCLLSGS